MTHPEWRLACLLVTLGAMLLNAASIIAAVHPAEVESYERKFDIPKEEAQARLEIQNRGTELSIAERLVLEAL
jgi:hypothetical protein